MRRRIVPDVAQLQIILGSLLGDGRIEGHAGVRRMAVTESAERERYVWWKYERLAQFTDEPPQLRDGRVSFSTIAHPLFDDLARMRRASDSRLVGLLTALGRAVWRTDALGTNGAALCEASPDEEPDLIREW